MEEVRKECWNDVFLTVIEKNSCIDAVTAERKVDARVRQAMSDELSARKSNVHDMIFISFAYGRLKSRFVAHSEEEKTAKALEVAMERPKIFRKETTGDIHCSHWRLSEGSMICNVGTEAAVNAPFVEVPTDNLALFSHEAALRMLHEYIGSLSSFIQAWCDSQLLHG